MVLFTISFLGMGQLDSANGAGLVPTATGPISKDCKGTATDCGDYALNDFVQLGINVSQMVLGLVGSLSLLMFIYGGFTFLLSAGSPEAIKKAQGIIIAAVIGLAIVFASYSIIQFVLQGLGYESSAFSVGSWNNPFKAN